MTAAVILLLGIVAAGALAWYLLYSGADAGPKSALASERWGDSQAYRGIARGDGW